MATKFELQHVGYPVAGRAIREDEWKRLSFHATPMSAYLAVRKNKAHLPPGTWDDHYRIVDGTGAVIPMDRLQDEYIEERTRRKLGL